MNENKVNDLIEGTLGQIRELAGTETVVGDPIYTPNGTLILPVSKISMGFATGGLDFGKKDSDGDKKPSRFGGGGGTGVTVSPVAFLIISPDGNVSMLPINAAAKNDTVDKVTSFIERSPELLEKFKKVFTSEKKKKKDDASDAPAAEEVKTEE